MAEKLPDGFYRFEYNMGQTYAGRLHDGARTGLWTISFTGGSRSEFTFRAGEWHGSASSWHANGLKEFEGQFDHGAMTGAWSWWFPDGRLAAHGTYADDRKVGAWEHFNRSGAPMDYADWDVEYGDWDWAWDDYAGAPRGENWPMPPPTARPVDD